MAATTRIRKLKKLRRTRVRVLKETTTELKIENLFIGVDMAFGESFTAFVAKLNKEIVSVVLGQVGI